jgi:uncharacterized protein with PCYCGC motif
MAGKGPWFVAAAAVAGLAATVLWVRQGRAATHPDPRPGVTAERVLAPATVPHAPGAQEAYEAARSAPGILDGVYCHCACSKHSGHRSLLTCFESEHAAHCDVCIGEAMLATQLAARGTSLAGIRQAVDAQYGR